MAWLIIKPSIYKCYIMRQKYQFPLRFIYESKEFGKDVTLLGIQLSRWTILSSRIFIREAMDYEASFRGSEPYEHRLRLITEEELGLVRERREELNAMLKLAGAHFEIPADDICWVCPANGSLRHVKAVDFATGQEAMGIGTLRAWALYVYLC